MAPKVVMVAEDAAFLRSVARPFARLRPSIGFEGFTDPVRALARMQAAAPDLLIADARMELMSGAALVAATYLIVTSPHRLSRFDVWLGRDTDPFGAARPAGGNPPQLGADCRLRRHQWRVHGDRQQRHSTNHLGRCHDDGRRGRRGA